VNNKKNLSEFGLGKFFFSFIVKMN